MVISVLCLPCSAESQSCNVHSHAIVKKVNYLALHCLPLDMYIHVYMDMDRIHFSVLSAFLLFLFVFPLFTNKLSLYSGIISWNKNNGTSTWDNHS